MQLHQLFGKHRKKKRVGRGGKRGTYAGRGGKGQTARAGHRIRPAIRDFLKQIPKKRGRHKHSFTSSRQRPLIISLGALSAAYKAGETVSPKTLRAKNLIASLGSGFPRVKILGGGRLAAKLTIQDCMVSQGAKKSIEEAGGVVREAKTRPAGHKKQALTAGPHTSGKTRNAS